MIGCFPPRKLGIPRRLEDLAARARTGLTAKLAGEARLAGA
jgi:hypothetical protein